MIKRLGIAIIIVFILTGVSFAIEKEIKNNAQDDRFVAYDNGTVYDKKTGLMWASRDNGSDIEWQDAKNYCEHYTAGGYTGWRMPTQEELAGLYDADETYKACEYDVHLTDLIRISCYSVWASAIRTKGLTYAILGDRAAGFDFMTARYDWYKPEQGYYRRALPVRVHNVTP